MINLFKWNINIIGNESKASVILDFIRFLSALIVFLFHFYVPVPGYQAVMIFFVLSGYFISSTVLKAVKYNNWSWSDYLLKRLTRLWIVLIPCLFLTYIWAQIQFSFFGESVISKYITWKIFIGNVFFLQEIIVPEYGINGPLWSLSYEFWYYILFPCLVLTFYASKKRFKILSALIFIAISLFVGERIMGYFLIWLIGALIPLLKPLKFKTKFWENIILLFSILISIASLRFLYQLLDITDPSYTGNGLQYYADLSVGITFAFFVYVVTSLLNTNTKRLRFNISNQLAGFSYTLYLTHYPLANLILTWRNSSSWKFTEVEGLLMKPVFAISIIVYAWIVGSLTEKHTVKVRKYIKRVIFIKLNNSNKKQQYAKNMQ